MIPKIDTNDIRERVNLAAIVGRDVKLRKIGAELRGPCPFCEDGLDRFAVFPSTRLFNCRVCGRKGDVIEYTMARRKVDFVTAAKWLSNGAGNLQSVAIPSIESPPELAGDDLYQWRYNLERMTARAMEHLLSIESVAAAGALTWLKSRGIGAEDAVDNGLGYNDRWREIIPGYKLPPGLAMPRWRHDGVITAVNVYLDQAARELTGHRRMFARGSCAKTFFNESRIADAQTLIIAEGELDAVLLSRFLPSSCLSITTGGAETLPDDLSILADKAVILALDNDQAGRRGVARWRDRLPSATVAELSKGKDITDYWKAGGDLSAWIDGYL